MKTQDAQALKSLGLSYYVTVSKKEPLDDLFQEIISLSRQMDLASRMQEYLWGHPPNLVATVISSFQNTCKYASYRQDNLPQIPSANTFLPAISADAASLPPTL